ncbi:Ulp1 peptidase [Bertholletia excelsa]
MGALTNNRKRSDDYYTSNYKLFYSRSSHVENPIDTHVSKKPRLSSFMNPTPESAVSSKSAASRIHRYPEPASQLPRDVHAPYRTSRFPFFSSANRKLKPSNGGIVQGGFADVREKVLTVQYDIAKKRAVDSLRYEQVIDVDAETDNKVAVPSDDSSVEVVEVVEDGREQRSQENCGVVPNPLRLGVKIPEQRDFQPSSSTMLSDLTTANLKVDNAATFLNKLSLNRELEDEDLPTHRKLHQSAERRNGKLSSLKFQIKLNERKRAELQLRRPERRLEEEDVLKEVLHEPFVPLTEEEEAEVSRAFSNSNRRKVLVTHENSNIEITGQLLQCLRPGAWLNDEVINVYLELLKEREKRDPKKFLKCHFFNTFFYKKLISGRNGYDFRAVRRWTTQKKLGYGLIECDKIFVPIHKEIHWCLAVINKKDEKFQYLDSLRGLDTEVLKKLATYLWKRLRTRAEKILMLVHGNKNLLRTSQNRKMGLTVACS